MSARVWIVDDDRAVRFVLAAALRDAGHDVDAFGSADDALAALDRGGAPDLLFTDVRMPGEDGLRLLAKLKQRVPALPVVVMSAYTDVASTAGACCFSFASNRSPSSPGMRTSVNSRSGAPRWSSAASASAAPPKAAASG